LFFRNPSLQFLKPNTVLTATDFAGSNSALLWTRMLHTLFQQHLRQDCEAGTSWSAAGNPPLTEDLELHEVTLSYYRLPFELQIVPFLLHEESEQARAREAVVGSSEKSCQENAFGQATDR
jgi:hypothetical protein